MPKNAEKGPASWSLVMHQEHGGLGKFQDLFISLLSPDNFTDAEIASALRSVRTHMKIFSRSPEPALETIPDEFNTRPMTGFLSVDRESARCDFEWNNPPIPLDLLSLGVDPDQPSEVSAARRLLEAAAVIVVLIAQNGEVHRKIAETNAQCVERATQTGAVDDRETPYAGTDLREPFSITLDNIQTAIDVFHTAIPRSADPSRQVRVLSRLVEHVPHGQVDFRGKKIEVNPRSGGRRRLTQMELCARAPFFFWANVRYLRIVSYNGSPIRARGGSPAPSSSFYRGTGAPTGTVTAPHSMPSFLSTDTSTI